MLDERSRKNLENVHPQLVRVVHRAAELCPIEFKVIEGVRTPTRQAQLYGQGRTAEQLRAKGLPGSLARPTMPKVTWTLSSRHFIDPKIGAGRAVDVLPAPFDWRDTAPFDAVAKAMFAAADEIGVKIRWGADWDRDGNARERGESDSPHFEIAD